MNRASLLKKALAGKQTDYLEINEGKNILKIHPHKKADIEKLEDGPLAVTMVAMHEIRVDKFYSRVLCGNVDMSGDDVIETTGNCHICDTVIPTLRSRTSADQKKAEDLRRVTVAYCMASLVKVVDGVRKMMPAKVWHFKVGASAKSWGHKVVNRYSDPEYQMDHPVKGIALTIEKEITGKKVMDVEYTISMESKAYPTPKSILDALPDLDGFIPKYSKEEQVLALKGKRPQRKDEDEEEEGVEQEGEQEQEVEQEEETVEVEESEFDAAAEEAEAGEVVETDEDGEEQSPASTPKKPIESTKHPGYFLDKESNEYLEMPKKVAPPPAPPKPPKAVAPPPAPLAPPKAAAPPPRATAASSAPTAPPTVRKGAAPPPPPPPARRPK